MAGINSFGAYVPFYRLAHEEIGRAWGLRSGKGERAVANVDEDSVTMAVEAVRDLLNGRDGQDVNCLIFASTTSPYAEKQASAIVAAAADLRSDMRTMDISNSLRASTSALLAAFEFVKSGAAESVIVAAADNRLAQPRSANEAIFGDAAAAIEVSRGGGAARLLGSYSIADEVIDVWRQSGDRFITTWEDRFAISQGYLRTVRQAVKGLFDMTGIGPSEISKAAFYAPDPGSLATIAKELGFNQEQIPDHFFYSVGNCGTAMPLLVFSSVLEEARPGQKILLVGYGQGCDALLFEVATQIQNIARPRRGVKPFLASKGYINYERYAKFRQLIETEAARRQPPTASAPQVLRDRDDIYRFRGQRCLSCNAIQYPSQRICIRCRSKDQFESVPLANKPATLFTFTLDYLNADPDPPTVMTIVDFQGGGRAYLMMTDRDINNIQIDQSVELTFRRVYEAEGFINYYWKCRPLR
jgi:3-hydroxy-3-methylglutaryl CoA synthase